MGFDAQAFATAFLEGQAVDIKARLKEAKDEIKRRKELARTVGVSQFRKRTQLYETMKNQIMSLKQQGMDQENLNLLMDNPTALVEVNDILKEHEKTFKAPMSAQAINSLIKITGDYSPTTDTNGKPLTLDQRLRRSVGLYSDNYDPKNIDPVEEDTNIFLSALNIGAEERLMAKQSKMDRTLMQMAEEGDYVTQTMSPIRIDYTKVEDISSLSAQRNEFLVYKNEVIKKAQTRRSKLILEVEKALTDKEKDKIDFELSELEKHIDEAESSGSYETSFGFGKLEEMFGVSTINEGYRLTPNIDNNTLINSRILEQARAERESLANEGNNQGDNNQGDNNQGDNNQGDGTQVNEVVTTKSDLSGLSKDQATDIIIDMIKNGNLVNGDTVKLPNGSILKISQPMIEDYK